MPVQPPDASHVHGGDTERGQVTATRFGGRPILPFLDHFFSPPTEGLQCAADGGTVVRGARLDRTASRRCSCCFKYSSQSTAGALVTLLPTSTTACPPNPFCLRSSYLDGCIEANRMGMSWTPLRVLLRFRTSWRFMPRRLDQFVKVPIGGSSHP